jgi:hypothetical protein
MPPLACAGDPAASGSLLLPELRPLGCARNCGSWRPPAAARDGAAPAPPPQTLRARTPCSDTAAASRAPAVTALCCQGGSGAPPHRLVCDASLEGRPPCLSVRLATLCVHGLSIFNCTVRKRVHRNAGGASGRGYARTSDPRGERATQTLRQPLVGNPIASEASKGAGRREFVYSTQLNMRDCDSAAQSLPERGCAVRTPRTARLTPGAPLVPPATTPQHTYISL